MRGELPAHHGEGLHQARHVLVAADIAGVEQKRIADLVALHDALALFRAGRDGGSRKPGSGAL